MSLTQFKNLSSWREDHVTIEGGKVYTLTFLDTKPNMFYIQNPNNNILKVSIGKIPRPDSYEFKIDANSTITLGRPTPTGQIYILNDGGVSTNITVYSVVKEFDMNVLKNLAISVDNATFQSDGIVRGFQQGVSVPSGSNMIGSVKVVNENFADLLNALIGIETSNVDNKTAINSILTKLGVYGEYNTLLPLVGAMLEELQTINNNTTSPDTTKAVYLNNATSFSYTATKNCIVHFAWMFNDSEKDGILKVGNDEKLTLFGGEQFGDFNIELANGETLTFDCEKTSLRCKYWVV